jgi:DNA invertase Pin-like site-specific DNA recombinase
MLGIYCRTSIQQEIENSTISQQRMAGIKFAEGRKFEYEIYEDEGISGFKISDDDQDPFNNRPAFTNLINDIKNKKVDKVWVWEHSRLSRNKYASAFIFNVFEKFKITLFENNKEFKLDDPDITFQMSILDAVAQYERQLIVSRTTRGKHKRINEGKRVYQKLYGYQSSGKDNTGYTIWKPVESEIETYKYISQRYLEGATLRRICIEVHETNKLTGRKLTSYATTIGNILRGCQYTGYQLTVEGSGVYKSFRKGKINSLQVLLDRKYWVKSIPFPLELITIEDWIKMGERLQINSKKFIKAQESRILRASKDIATGLIECGKCEMRYYSRTQISRNKITGEIKNYLAYYHNSVFQKLKCEQRPKSFKIEYVDEIFKIFYFYFYLVFDNTNDLIVETQRNIKQLQLKLKEKIIKSEKETSAIEKRIIKFRNVLDTSDDPDVIKTLAKQITTNEEKYEELTIELSKIKIELELQNEKFSQTEREMAYYDVKERINDWFFKLNVEEQRNELIRIIQKCQIFNHHLIIDAGQVVFLFDIQKHYVFDMKMLENLNKDEIYKKNFVEMKGKLKAKMLNDRRIHDVNLQRDKEIKTRVFEYLAQKYSVYYNFIGKTKLVSFVPLTGIMSLEIEDLKNENAE